MTTQRPHIPGTPTPQHFGLLTIAQLSVSAAPLMIVLCGMAPGMLSAGRLLVTAALLLPFALPRIRAELGVLTRKEWAALVAAGVCFGAHFVLFSASFQYTSFESAVVLLAFQPAFAALLGRVMLGERTSLGMWLSILIGAAGLVLLVWDDFCKDQALLDGKNVLGDLCVITACFSIVLTFVWGRRLRQTVSYPTWVMGVFGIGGLTALGWALAAGETLESPRADPWLWLVALIIVPTIMGHSLFNYLLKHLRVFYINIVFVLEPMLALFGKWMIDRPDIFGPARFGAMQMIAGIMLIGGVAVGLAARERAVRLNDMPAKAETSSR